MMAKGPMTERRVREMFRSGGELPKNKDERHLAKRNTNLEKGPKQTCRIDFLGIRNGAKGLFGFRGGGGEGQLRREENGMHNRE